MSILQLNLFTLDSPANHPEPFTRGKNTLDNVYFNIKHAYKAIPLPHLGQTTSLCFSPHIPFIWQTKLKRITINTWLDDALPNLPDFFEQTQWKETPWRQIYRHCTVLHQALHWYSHCRKINPGVSKQIQKHGWLIRYFKMATCMDAAAHSSLTYVLFCFFFVCCFRMLYLVYEPFYIL